MSSGSNPVLAKEDFPKEIWKIATSLSDEAQNAAIRKCRELEYDLDKGRIPLGETLINLSRDRDVLIDAVEKNKLVQLPLKLQQTLLSQSQKVSDALNILVNGTDAILVLEYAVEDLTATFWRYNLHNLSDQILGFHQKMNQLKAQETLIREVHRQAQDFQESSKRANQLLHQIEEQAEESSARADSAKSSIDQIAVAMAKVVEDEQRVNALTIQGQQYDEAAAKYAANAKIAAADVEAIAEKAHVLQSEIEAAKASLAELTSKTDETLSSTEGAIESHLKEFREQYDELQANTENETTNSLAQLATKTDETLSSAKAAIESHLKDFQGQYDQLKAITEKETSALSGRLDTSIAELTAAAQEQIQGLVSSTSQELSAVNQSATQLVTDTELSRNKAAVDAETRLNKQLTAQDSEYKSLVLNLGHLEDRIKESIERATGYTLFHSFQKRQLDLAKSKRFWAYALAVAVIVSLIASGVFIYSLRFVKVYDAAFFLKLSISLPLIYAIAFCNLQYSRERRLEEEYAFKSNISISLDPYQKLVAQLVDKSNPEELAKYTGFVIESVNRGFSSPTGVIFDDHKRDRNSAEQLIKVLGDFIEPVIKAVKK